MIVVEIPSGEWFDDARQVFVTIPKVTLRMEHSLKSLAKWESKWHKPFLIDERKNPKWAKSVEEKADYYRCMTLDTPPELNVYYTIPYDEEKRIEAYIADSMTASWFRETHDKRPSRQRITTAEVIYAQMCEFGIPFECEKWHLNRLLTLIRMCAERESIPQKKSKQQLAREFSALNAARLKGGKHG